MKIVLSLVSLLIFTNSAFAQIPGQFYACNANNASCNQLTLRDPQFTQLLGSLTTSGAVNMQAIQTAFNVPSGYMIASIYVNFQTNTATVVQIAVPTPSPTPTPTPIPGS